MVGMFITFEGVDGCGKSTQMRFLGEYLESLGYEVVYTREPGGCKISEMIREILLSNENGEMTDRTEALLYAAARAQHVSEVIKPAISQGKIVLCDRFIDSSLAYQGIGRQLGIDKIMEINDFAMEGFMPSVTFFLDYPPEKATVRMKKRKTHDRMENEEADFHKKLYKGFVELAEKYPKRIIRINVSGDKQSTRGKIQKEMDKILKGENP